MSADNDGDSQMLSSPDDSDSQTPLAQSTLLSPPESQHPTPAMPLSTPAVGANANGKRPINTISNGADDSEDVPSLTQQLQQPPQQQQQQPTNGKPRPALPIETHERSGYRWNREEDQPGYMWLNKKAVDEYHRSWDSVVHRDYMLKAKYGDPFEMADRERAVLNSLKQQ